jgi:hypothetical protein
MRRESRRTLVVLVVVFAVLLVAALAVTTRQANLPTTTPYPFTRVFPDLPENDIAAVRISDLITGEQLTMTRADNGRWITAAGVDIHETGLLIARTISLLPFDGTITPENAGDSALYGFTPYGTLEVQALTFSSAAHIVVVGYLAPGERAYYGKIDEDDRIYILQRPAIDYLLQQLRNNAPS